MSTFQYQNGVEKQDEKQNESEPEEEIVEDEESEEEEEQEEDEKEKPKEEKQPKDNDDDEQDEQENEQEQAQFFYPDYGGIDYDFEHDNDDESDDEIDEVEEQNRLAQTVLKQLMVLNQLQRKENKKKEKRFIPSIKGYLKLNFEKKTKKIRETPTLVKNLLYLANCIVHKKVNVGSINDMDHEILQHICNKNTPVVGLEQLTIT